MKALEDLTGVDRAWLQMDRPSNPMMIVGLITLASALDLAQLRELIKERFVVYRRFGCVPINSSMGGSWVESANFNVDDHVLCQGLPEPRGQTELERLAGELASTPFNPGRPLWTFHLVDNYAHGSAIIVRIHHAYADGIALMRVLLSIADTEPAAGSARPRRGKQRTAAADGANPSWFSGLWTDTLHEGVGLTERAVHYALHPAEAASLARKALGLTAELARLGLLADDPMTCLKGAMSGIRVAAWTEPLPLREVRTLAHVLGCTVNDVLMATLAGALGRHLESRGEAVSGMTIRASVPVNLRAEGVQPSMGNCFGLVFVDLPIGVRHPLERLYSVRAAMQKLKGSTQALATLALMQLIGSMPSAVEDPVVGIFSAKASVVASNLPGPQQQLRLAGIPISGLLFWVPQAGNIGVGVSMLSYHNKVHFGVMADRQLIPKPAELVAQIRIEFERLVYLLLLGGDRSTG